MNNQKSFIKRALAVLLGATLLLNIIPVFSLLPTTVSAADNATFVSLPITIRDYAADGMLFEFNQLGLTTDTEIGGAAPTQVFTGATIGSYTNESKTGYVRYTSTGTSQYITYTLSGETRTSLRYCAIKYRTNAAYSSQPTIGHRESSTIAHYVNFDTKGYNNTSAWTKAVIDLGSGSATVSYVSIFPRLANGKYIDIAYIAFFSEKDDATTYNANDGTVVPEAVYHNGDNKGFSLLETDGKDKFNDLGDDTIAGTKKIINGSWGETTEPAPIEAVLNSGAKQLVYGAYIRTNLVQSKLGANGKLLYTEATVTYLANYMKKTLAEVWVNEDNSYNLWYVMGQKPEDLNGDDLATKLRAQIKNEGSYDEAKSKFESGALREYTDVTSYYDAAYFLLHSTFEDNIGYGVTIPEYKQINLVAKEDADGNTYYVFNSAYDESKYDVESGVIYNTQTENIKLETESATNGYVRGNKLPYNTFNPIANMGYGKSGDTYKKAYNDEQSHFYDETNYHLTLEGHAQFIYYEDDSLYFTFTGDDDVYLFINGIRVLDLGAAHSISKVTINLNDVAELCGLKDGQPYTFDFFYMERHGTAANFGIETNIKIVDPSMLTTKTGYQNGVNTGYNGFVAPLVPVTYEFALQNNGKTPIKNLTFRDGDIGATENGAKTPVDLSKDSITLNSETNIIDLVVTLYNPDGTKKAQYSQTTDVVLTEQLLKEILAAGLDIGEKISIYGFKYTVLDSDWSAGNNIFPNRVYTTAVSTGQNTSEQVLNGTAEWKVQKREYEYQDYHIYEWVGHSVSLTKEELLQPIFDAHVDSFKIETAVIRPCSASGSTTSTNLNEKAVWDLSNYTVKYTGTVTGVDTFYYIVEEETFRSAVIAVTVYSYDVVPDKYVIDYGLSLNLSTDEHGVLANDTLYLSENIFATSYSITGIQDATTNYGEFAYGESKLTYTPSKIMDNIDSVQVNVRVIENEATELTKFTGVDMYEAVTVIPANVMYYEDNFPGIDFTATDNKWIRYEGSFVGTEQSADQSSNYGSDPNYTEDKSGSLNGSDNSTLNGDASNGTIKMMNVAATGTVMAFKFHGTGFELVSRTTEDPYAVISVLVYPGTLNEDGSVTYATIPTVMKPVITESKGGDLYQVPVISITDLDQGYYYVEVQAAKSTASAPRVLYLDGIRIYDPLTVDDAKEYYRPDEALADFHEIKTEIMNKKIMYADAVNNTIVTGSTLIEDVTGNHVLTAVDDISIYLDDGPNNEIYLDGNSANNLIIFYLKSIGGFADANKTIQIGVHRKVDSTTSDTGYVNLVYGSTAADIINGTNLYQVTSGTEQCVTIDVSKLQQVDGQYLVIIGTNGSESFTETLVLTSLKLAGYEITSALDQITTEVEAAKYAVNTVAAIYSLDADFGVIRPSRPEKFDNHGGRYQICFDNNAHIYHQSNRRSGR